MYSLRHSAASALVKDRKSLKMISLMLGHYVASPFNPVYRDTQRTSLLRLSLPVRA